MATYSKLEKIRKAIIQNSKRPFEMEPTVNSLLDWLQQIPFPPYQNKSSWREILNLFPPSENPPELQSGLQVRINFKLYTSQQSYMITLLECLDSDASDINIITVHKNWQHAELLKQKSIDISYHQAFTDMLKAKHTLWAQTYRLLYLHEALNSCLLAIMGNELKGVPPIETKEAVKKPHVQITAFPDPE